MNVSIHHDSPWWGLIIHLDQLLGGMHGLMYNDVRVLGIFDKPGVGERIAPKDYFQAIPFKGETPGQIIFITPELPTHGNLPLHDHPHQSVEIPLRLFSHNHPILT